MSRRAVVAIICALALALTACPKQKSLQERLHEECIQNGGTWQEGVCAGSNL